MKTVKIQTSKIILIPEIIDIFKCSSTHFKGKFT